MQTTQKIPIHLCTEKSLETNSFKSSKAFPFTKAVGHSQAFNPLTSMLQLALLKFSPRMVSLGVLCVLLSLFVSFADYSFCPPPPPWLAMAPKVQHLAFGIFPSVFTIHKIHPMLVLHRLLKNM